MGECIPIAVLSLRPGARVPGRQSTLASGFDLHACLDVASIEVGTTPVLVPTGIAIAAPEGSDVQIRPRSGLSSRGVMAVLGTLDADYRGELFVTMYCLPDVGRYEIHDGDRIAQLVVSILAPVEWTVVERLDTTERGERGHGSTGRA
jgi:dUTP pyrophosphatase